MPAGIPLRYGAMVEALACSRAHVRRLGIGQHPGLVEAGNEAGQRSIEAGAARSINRRISAPSVQHALLLELVPTCGNASGSVMCWPARRLLLRVVAPPDQVPVSVKRVCTP